MFSKIQKLILPLVVLLMICSFIFPISFVEAKCKCVCGDDDRTDKGPVDDENACIDMCAPLKHGIQGCTPITEETNNTKKEADYKSAKLDNPLANNETSIPNLIAKVIKIILGLIGVASLVMFIYAGFLWLTAQGKMEQIKKGRDTMLYAVIGLVIVFSSYIVLNYLFGILTF